MVVYHFQNVSGNLPLKSKLDTDDFDNSFMPSRSFFRQMELICSKW